MPYKIKGKEVWHLKDGKWQLKQTAGSNAKAVSTVRLLQGIEHGWKPDFQSKNCVVSKILGRGDFTSKNLDGPGQNLQSLQTEGRSVIGLNYIVEKKKKKKQ